MGHVCNALSWALAAVQHELSAGSTLPALPATRLSGFESSPVQLCPFLPERLCTGHPWGVEGGLGAPGHLPHCSSQLQRMAEMDVAGGGQQGAGRAALGKHRFRFTLLFWLHHVACRILVPHLGIEPRPLAVKAASPIHWTAGKFLRTRLLKREGPAQPSGLCGGLRPRPPIWLPVRVLPSPPVSWSEPPHSPGGAPVEEGARLGPLGLYGGASPLTGPRPRF